MTIMTREQLDDWLDFLARDNILIAPRNVQDVLLYNPIQNSSEVVWNYTRPVMSIKDVFFPSTERLLTIELNDQTVKLEEHIPEGKQVLFGVRPCDSRGLLAFDALFIDTDPVDNYYAQRRENTIIIGLACTEMADTCFCTSTGGAPDDTTGMDVMVYPVDRGYKVSVISEKGSKVVEELDIYQGEVEFQPFEIKENYLIPEKDSMPSQFDDKFWYEMSERCISCRICAYICPTCRCFDVRDEPVITDNGKNQFERVRCWDSCAGEAYRRIAGGHNPRKAKADRLRNRFMCKFYYFPEQYGPAACTGCGRCIDSCPVNIDITEVISYLTNETVGN